MKNKKCLLALVIAIFLLVFIPTSATLCKRVVEKIELIPNGDFMYIASYGEKLSREDNVLTEYAEFKELFGGDKLTEEDFKNNNYVMVEVINHCEMVAVTPVKYEISNYDIDITIRYKQGCESCSETYTYYLLKVEKEIDEANINVNYEVISREKCK